MKNLFLLLCTKLLLLTFLTNCALGQDSLKNYSFKNSHNSYDKSSSLAEQIDSYNVWCIELDLCRKSGELCVTHYGTEGCHDFRDLLVNMYSAVSTRHRITFLWFDIKHDPLCDYWDDFNFEEIRGVVYSVIPQEEVYTLSMFDVVDGGKWPSLDTLLSRGHHYIIVIDGGHPIDKKWDAQFFVTSGSIWLAKLWAAFINTEAGSLPDGETPDLTDRHLWRSYDLNESDTYDSALDKGFHILGTDHFKTYFSEDDRIHPPIPLVVDCSANNDMEFGSYGLPFTTVYNGVLRALPGMEIMIRAGTYHEQLTISKPLTLRSEYGTATITSQ